MRVASDRFEKKHRNSRLYHCEHSLESEAMEWERWVPCKSWYELCRDVGLKNEKRKEKL